MRPALWLLSLLTALGLGCARAASPAPTPVLQHHRNPSRDGLYVDPALTHAAVRHLRRDPAFAPQLPPASTFYAQPLFVPDGPAGKELLLVASEQNVVYALDASSGAIVWRRPLGDPVPLASLSCGNINPLGVTGTPVINPVGRTLFVDAMTTPDQGRTKRHLVFALSLDDGSVRSGWPVDVAASVRAGDIPFDAAVQNQRGALALVGGTVYVPYGGHEGDCGDYHGWVVAIPEQDPRSATAWATPARGGGSWAPGGLATDGRSIFAATGNTIGATDWSGGEAILRFTPGPTLADWFAPSDWEALDARDADIGGSGPVLLELPGANPSALAVSLGKNGVLYLLDRNDLGHVGHPLFSAQVASGPIINAAAAYATAKGTYVAFRGRGASCPAVEDSDLTAVRIAPGAPPSASIAWCARQNGRGSPMVTTSDGRSDPVVWSVGAEGDGRLHGFDGDTGVELVAVSVGAARRFNTPIAAGGRILVAVDGGVVALAPAP